MRKLFFSMIAIFLILAFANQVQPVSYTVNPSAANQGAVVNNKSAASLVAAIGAKSAILVFPHNSPGLTTNYAFGTGLIIPSNITVVVENGAKLTVAGGETVTINGVIFSDATRKFYGAGTVIVTSYPQDAAWWGLTEAATYQGLSVATLTATNIVGYVFLPDQTGQAGNFLNTDGSIATWIAIPGGGDMLRANNLSDVINKLTGRTNLGVAIGSDVPASFTIPIPINSGGIGTKTLTPGIVLSNNTALYSTSSIPFASVAGGQAPLTLPLVVGQGGSGAPTLTGILLGHGISPFTGTSTIPAASIAGGVGGDMYKADNLTGLADNSVARINLGVSIGQDVNASITIANGWKGIWIGDGTTNKLISTSSIPVASVAGAAAGGDMFAANNLSELTDKSLARTNLGVAIASDVSASFTLPFSMYIGGIGTRTLSYGIVLSDSSKLYATNTIPAASVTGAPGMVYPDSGLSVSAGTAWASSLTPLAYKFVMSSATPAWQVSNYGVPPTICGNNYSWKSNGTDMGCWNSYAEFLLITNNLSDLNSKTTARTNLGVAIGSDVPASFTVPIPFGMGGIGTKTVNTGIVLSNGTLLWSSGSISVASVSGAQTWITGSIPYASLTGAQASLTVPLGVNEGGSAAKTLTGILIGHGSSAFTGTSTLNFASITGTVPYASLSGVQASLTVPLGVNEGGSGAKTLTGILIGNGSSSFTATSTIPFASLITLGATNSVFGINSANSLGFYTNISIDDSAWQFYNSTDPTKRILFSPASSTSGSLFSIIASITSTRTININNPINNDTLPSGLYYARFIGMTASRTYTLPDSDATLSGGGASLTLPLSIYNGGIGTRTLLNGIVITNGTTFNSTGTIPIASVTGVASMTVPLGVNEGGSGAKTLTGVLLGNGSSAFTATSVIPLASVASAVGLQTIDNMFNKTIQSPNILSPTIKWPTDILASTTLTLTASQCYNSVVNNYGQATNVTVYMPTPAYGMYINYISGQATPATMAFIPVASNSLLLATNSATWAPSGFRIQGMAVGQILAFCTFQTGGSSWSWVVSASTGTSF